MTSGPPTRFPELNELLVELVERARAILAETFVGAYLQGSFAVGDADEHSDCDFLIPITTQPPAPYIWRAVRAPVTDRSFTSAVSGSIVSSRFAESAGQ